MLKGYAVLCVGLLSWLFISGCNGDSAIEDNQERQNIQVSEALDIEVADAIERALINADVRLLHSKGRRIVVPGLESYDLVLLESQCGLKALENSTDVLKTPEQRQQQKQQYRFAKRYNQLMYQQCLAELNE